MKFNKLINIVMCTFVITSFCNASNNNSLFGNATNNFNSNSQLFFSNIQSKSSNNINNNDYETLSDDEKKYNYVTHYITERSSKKIEITFGSIKNNTPYKVIVNDIYNNSSSSTIFPTIKKLANSLNNTTNNLLSARKGIAKYNEETKKYTYTLEGVEIDDFRIYSLTLNGNDSNNPSIVNLIFNISEVGESILFNNIKCNNISKLNISFGKNIKSPLTNCCINNITSNNNMNITANVPLCINYDNDRYFNYENNSVDISVGIGDNIILLNPFYIEIQKFNNIFFTVFNNVIMNNNIIDMLNKYQEALRKFSKKNEAKKLNIYKYMRAIVILKNVIKSPDSEMQAMKYFYNVHKMFSNDLYNVLK